jgi:hypothetical protein
MSSTRNQLTGIKNRQQFLYILVFSMAAVGVWVGSSIFFSQKKTGIDSALQKLAIPLNPSINVDILNRIQAKKTFSDAELTDFGIYKLVSSRDGKEQRVVTINVPDDILDPKVDASPPPPQSQSFNDLSVPVGTESASPSAQFAPVSPAL